MLTIRVIFVILGCVLSTDPKEAALKSDSLTDADSFADADAIMLPHSLALPECAICFDNIQSPNSVSLPCTHSSSFHDACLKQALARRPSCPICDQDCSLKPAIDRDSAIISPDLPECAICLDSIDPAAPSSISLPCTHSSSFHEACLRRALGNNPSCPLCRVQYPSILSLAPNNPHFRPHLAEVNELRALNYYLHNLKTRASLDAILACFIFLTTPHFTSRVSIIPIILSSMAYMKMARAVGLQLGNLELIRVTLVQMAAAFISYVETYYRVTTFYPPSEFSLRPERLFVAALPLIFTIFEGFIALLKNTALLRLISLAE